MTKTKVTTFVQLVIALIKGDDAEAKAIKIQRKASASITAQIAVKVAHTLSLEESLESAQEHLSLMRVNRGELISDSEAYISRLLEANRRVKSCKIDLESHLETIKFLEGELELINK